MSKKTKKLKERCRSCRRRAKVKHECKTCIKLQEAGKVETVFTICACSFHAEKALQDMKKHALVAHPVNLLRAGVAALKGEDVF